LFQNTIFESTLPPEVLDAVTSTLAVLKSPTVIRLQDGSFWGWEGSQDAAGSCQGTCQHVYNYQYALSFLFPQLERSIRKNELTYSLGTDGKLGNRMGLPLGAGAVEGPAFDG
jgi:hypothetical protein